MGYEMHRTSRNFEAKQAKCLWKQTDPSRGLIVHQQRYRLSDSNTNVNIKFIAHEARVVV